MAINPNVQDNYQTLEYGKFVRIENDTTYPVVTAAGNGGQFHHYAVLTQIVNASEIGGTTAGSTAAVTQVSAKSAESQQVVAANSNRKGLEIYNNSTSTMYIKFGSAATIDIFTFRLITNASYEMPQNYFTGEIHAIWSNTPTGSANITEIT